MKIARKRKVMTYRTYFGGGGVLDNGEKKGMQSEWIERKCYKTDMRSLNKYRENLKEYVKRNSTDSLNRVRVGDEGNCG